MTTPRFSVTTRPSTAAREVARANAQSSVPPAGVRDVTVANQREIARAQNANVEANRRRIQQQNESIAYDRDLNSFRNNLVTALRGVSIVFKDPIKADPGFLVDSAFSLARSSGIFGESELLNVSNVSLNPLNQLTRSDVGAIRYPARVVQKVINKPLKKTVVEFVVRELAKYPRLFGGRALANAVPVIGDHIGAALAAAEEYAETGNIVEAIILGTNYATISRAAGATAAAYCATTAAVGGSIIPIAGTVVGGVSGATLCDAAASVAAGEAYLAFVRPGIRIISERVASTPILTLAPQNQTQQQTNIQSTIQSAPIGSAPIILITNKTSSQPLVVNRNPINQRINSRLSTTRRTNEVNAERANIAQTTLESSANAYRYPVSTTQPTTSTSLQSRRLVGS